MANFSQFIRETKQEARKVTWPSRKETVTTTIVVLAMVVIVGIFLLVIDGVISNAVKFLLELGA